jgi:ubiquinone/menaquinone biosynthesis C-methylase UbiE
LLLTPSGKVLLEAGTEILKRLEEAEQTMQKINLDQFKSYVHGYSEQEAARLYNQAASIAEILHWDSFWDQGSLVLDAGCGVGAQMKTICVNNPEVNFVCLDWSAGSLAKAEVLAGELELSNVSFRQGDLYELPYGEGHFDHVFVCFVLEHLQNPAKALSEINRVLKKDGTLSLIEGDHGSTYFHPHSEVAIKAVQAQVKLQAQNGGDANIGRRLYPLLKEAGFEDAVVSPRQVYVDEACPSLVEGFIVNTFTAMIQGIAEEAVAKKLLTKAEMERGVVDLLETAKPGGTFCYTFFKALAKKA